ncbi:hypothetical protein GLOTRDRAFT_138625 [Gloeophyllum trabeum ATCC 11539]|uniref:Uncharacterized protein n=1 Tax=Gloeophyllum trabeum (strain ATCC 11539 / FP-39264 / Madison 617) TaxID=670483 RepID=S7Q8L8_GLOTA|nr:uncharacterized protein GLOTRDRAFT_138625 [Gloeophyllum trabeum ATCC 11539]EPQ55872.1 hypothetical protein GLOTRDRAFT_138625 [Gloeophyllum trabeum ATCC 11539]
MWQTRPCEYRVICHNASAYKEYCLEMSRSEATIKRFKSAMAPNESPDHTADSLPLQRKRARMDADHPGDDAESLTNEGHENIDPTLLNDTTGTVSFNSPEVLQFHAGATASTPDNGRLRHFAHRYSKKLKLTKEQQERGDDFNARGMPERLYIIWADQQAILNKLDKIITAQPPYTVSNSLKKSIDKYVLATLLSSKISHYKGDVPRIYVEDLLKKYQAHELPKDLERNPADWSKVQTYIQYSLTQLRSKWKKAIATSLKNKDKSKCTNIYKLAKTFATSKNTVTAQLCARVAVMREVYKEKYGTAHDGENEEEEADPSDYWLAVNGRLELMRELAEGDQGKMNRALKMVLEEDRKAYGVYVESERAEEVEEEEDSLQQVVDEVIEEDV